MRHGVHAKSAQLYQTLDAGLTIRPGSLAAPQVKLDRIHRILLIFCSIISRMEMTQRNQPEADKSA